MSKKDKLINFWISIEDAAKLKKYADTVGLTQSAYIRRMTLKKPVATKPSTCHVAVKQKLSALGDELTSLVPLIDEPEALRLRELVFDAYNQCKGTDTDGL